MTTATDNKRTEAAATLNATVNRRNSAVAAFAIAKAAAIKAKVAHDRARADLLEATMERDESITTFRDAHNAAERLGTVVPKRDDDGRPAQHFLILARAKP